MTLHQLYERAYQEHIEIDEVHMRELKAVSFPEGWIAIDPRRFRNETELKCILAHEIGHIETGSFYNVLTPFEIRERCEHKANKRAVHILTPLDEVRLAFRRGYRTAWALAELFDVTQEFAEMAMGIYQGDLIAESEHEQLNAVLSRDGLKVSNGHSKLPQLMRASDLIGR